MTQPSPLILAFGDSLIAGFGLAAADGFPAQLQRALRGRRPQAAVLNWGVSGDTTGDALRRLPRLLSGLAARPDLAIVQIGPNDLWRGLSPERTRANLDAILTEFGRCGIPVLLATVTPPAFLMQRAAGHVGIHDEVARRHGVATCAFFPAGVLGHPEMVLIDRVHPNARAIAAVVAHMLPIVERLLAGRTTAAA
jgi:acyl-CoA thioesterase-1